MVAFALVRHVDPAISSEIVSAVEARKGGNSLETSGIMKDTKHEALNMDRK